jgi:hypothetical protein
MVSVCSMRKWMSWIVFLGCVHVLPTVEGKQSGVQPDQAKSEILVVADTNNAFILMAICVPFA